MISRYARPILADLWNESSKYAAWAEVERAHLLTLVDRGWAPQGVLQAFDQAVLSKTAADFLAREQETNHDVIAFVAEIGEAMGPFGVYLHKGLTSSDVVDTAMIIRILKSLDFILESLYQVRIKFAIQSFTHANTLCIGRTHGIHAEPMSFGQILCSYFAEFQRVHLELRDVRQGLAMGKLSGAIGTYSQWPPDVELQTLGYLNLRPETVATQVIPRQRLVRLAQACVNCAQAVERFALNLRHWARTELGEVLEPFGTKQKGSSAMPHKKNPILAENLCGLARAVRGYASILQENNALWHERDISHSSAERLALGDILALTDFMCVRLADLVERMEVRPQAMLVQLWRTGGLWASQSVLSALVDKGLDRTVAYELVQSVALPLSQKVGLEPLHPGAFLEALVAHPEVILHVSQEILAPFFDPLTYLKHVDHVFERLFGVFPQAFPHPTQEQIATLEPLQSRMRILWDDNLPASTPREGCVFQTQKSIVFSFTGFLTQQQLAERSLASFKKIHPGIHKYTMEQV